MKTVAPDISIILPTWNRVGLLEATIRSIRAQSFVNWELIIVDDGSTDHTKEMVLDLGDDRIRYYYTRHTGVGGRNRNIGLSLSKGAFIAFMDSDDLWMPNKLQAQMRALWNYPTAGFTVTNGYNFMEEGKPLEFFYRERSGWQFGSVYESYFRSELAGFTQALLFRRECLVLTGGLRESGSFSDVHFLLRLALNYPAVILYEPLIQRRLHGNNYIHHNWKESCLEGFTILEENKSILPPSLRRQAFFRFHINFGEKYLKYHQPARAIGEFAKAWWMKPGSLTPVKKSAKAFLRLIHKKNDFQVSTGVPESSSTIP
jgi:glycosyltransferase involved in cell wall biosynthesis